MNPFSHLLTPEFKNLFIQAIDTILDPNSGLVNSCTLEYSGAPTSQTICNNCIYDTISLVSSNIYNGSGPQPFSDGAICPVCEGIGLMPSSGPVASESVSLAVITDSKSFINVSDAVNISSGTIQTLCRIDLLPKLNNAAQLVFNDIKYRRLAMPQTCGLADHQYVVVLWGNN